MFTVDDDQQLLIDTTRMMDSFQPPPQQQQQQYERFSFENGGISVRQELPNGPRVGNWDNKSSSNAIEPNDSKTKMKMDVDDEQMIYDSDVIRTTTNLHRNLQSMSEFVSSTIFPSPPQESLSPTTSLSSLLSEPSPRYGGSAVSSPEIVSVITSNTTITTPSTPSLTSSRSSKNEYSQNYNQQQLIQFLLTTPSSSSSSTSASSTNTSSSLSSSSMQLSNIKSTSQSNPINLDSSSETFSTFNNNNNQITSTAASSTSSFVFCSTIDTISNNSGNIIRQSTAPIQVLAPVRQPEHSSSSSLPCTSSISPTTSLAARFQLMSHSSNEQGSSLSSSATTTTTSNNNNGIQLGQACLVCGDSAIGKNFGVLTCGSCKIFFRRNIIKAKIRCRNKDRCQINKSNRRNCASCRLRKCIQLGMKVKQGKASKTTNGSNEALSSTTSAESGVGQSGGSDPISMIASNQNRAYHSQTTEQTTVGNSTIVIDDNEDDNNDDDDDEVDIDDIDDLLDFDEEYGDEDIDDLVEEYADDEDFVLVDEKFNGQSQPIITNETVDMFDVDLDNPNSNKINDTDYQDLPTLIPAEEARSRLLNQRTQVIISSKSENDDINNRGQQYWHEEEQKLIRETVGLSLNCDNRQQQQQTSPTSQSQTTNNVEITLTNSNQRFQISTDSSTTAITNSQEQSLQSRYLHNPNNQQPEQHLYDNCSNLNSYVQNLRNHSLYVPRGTTNTGIHLTPSQKSLSSKSSSRTSSPSLVAEIEYDKTNANANANANQYRESVVVVSNNFSNQNGNSYLRLRQLNDNENVVEVEDDDDDEVQLIEQQQQQQPQTSASSASSYLLCGKSQLYESISSSTNIEDYGDQNDLNYPTYDDNDDYNDNTDNQLTTNQSIESELINQQASTSSYHQSTSTSTSTSSSSNYNNSRHSRHAHNHSHHLHHRKQQFHHQFYREMEDEFYSKSTQSHIKLAIAEKTHFIMKPQIRVNEFMNNYPLIVNMLGLQYNDSRCLLYDSADSSGASWLSSLLPKELECIKNINQELLPISHRPQNNNKDNYTGLVFNNLPIGIFYANRSFNEYEEYFCNKNNELSKAIRDSPTTFKKKKNNLLHELYHLRGVHNFDDKENAWAILNENKEYALIKVDMFKQSVKKEMSTSHLQYINSFPIEWRQDNGTIFNLMTYLHVLDVFIKAESKYAPENNRIRYWVNLFLVKRYLDTMYQDENETLQKLCLMMSLLHDELPTLSSECLTACTHSLKPSLLQKIGPSYAACLMLERKQQLKQQQHQQHQHNHPYPNPHQHYHHSEHPHHEHSYEYHTHEHTHQHLHEHPQQQENYLDPDPIQGVKKSRLQ